METPADADVGTPPASIHLLGRHAAFAIRDYAETFALLKEKGIEVL